MVGDNNIPVPWLECYKVVSKANSPTRNLLPGGTFPCPPSRRAQSRTAYPLPNQWSAGFSAAVYNSPQAPPTLPVSGMDEKNCSHACCPQQCCWHCETAGSSWGLSEPGLWQRCWSMYQYCQIPALTVVAYSCSKTWYFGNCGSILIRLPDSLPAGWAIRETTAFHPSPPFEDGGREGEWRTMECWGSEGPSAALFLRGTYHFCSTTKCNIWP